MQYHFNATNNNASGSNVASTNAAVAVKPLLITAGSLSDVETILKAINDPAAGISKKLLQLASIDGYQEILEDGSDKEEYSEAQSTGVAGWKGPVWARHTRDITEERLRKRKCRLILRNLSFQATEENIASKLISFGPLTEVAIARVPVTAHNDEEESSNKKRRFKTNKSNEGEPKLKSRGFAFVTFLCESDAIAAVAGCSKLKICNREFALDFCVAKDRHLTAAAAPSADAGDTATDTVDGVTETNDEVDKDRDKGDDVDDSKDQEEQDTEDENSESDIADIENEELDNNNTNAALDSGRPKKQKIETKPADIAEGCTVFVRFY